MKYLTMETDLNPVLAGGISAGWVSGSPVGIAAVSGVSGGIVFDLGPDWMFFSRVQIGIHLPTNASGASLIAIRPFGNDIPVNNEGRRLLLANSPNDNVGTDVSNSAQGSTQTFVVIPQGRFVCSIFNNNGPTFPTVAGTKVRLLAFPIGSDK